MLYVLISVNEKTVQTPILIFILLLRTGHFLLVIVLTEYCLYGITSNLPPDRWLLRLYLTGFCEIS